MDWRQVIDTDLLSPGDFREPGQDQAIPSP